ncbi:MAG TPA: hypothetical protein PKA41_11085 [Verrucomicrobiota bacterium]|nr:hypothetical protein [Verrucomicrobiota bacterium]
MNATVNPPLTPPRRGTGDTSNWFYVRGVPGKPGVFFFETNTAASILCVVTRAEALNLAAWLAVLADPDGTKFDRIREAVRR